MLRLSSKMIRNFSQHLKLPTSAATDMSNMLGFIGASDKPTLTLAEKLSYFTPGSMYTNLDEFSRQLIFTLTHDYQLGLPAAVFLISCLLRGIYFYPNIRGQIAALKMKQLKPYMDKFREKSRIAQMTRNMALMKSAREELKDVQKKKGVDNFYAFVNITQIPFLITWFLSLRYIAALPEVYPSVSQGFLWMSDLSTYDPYFILPLASAFLSSYSIVISPGLKNANVMPILEPFVKYFKYLPFLSLPITGFFPAILNIYWCTLAVNQAILMSAMNSKWISNKISAPQQVAQPQIMQAVFVEEKKPSSPEAEPTKTDNTKNVNVELGNVQKLQILTKKPKKAKKVDQ